MDPTEDHHGLAHYENKKYSLELLKEFINQSLLLDVWHLRNPDLFQFTWRRRYPSPSYSRLDFFLISAGLNDFINSCRIEPAYKADHLMVIIKIKVLKSHRGKGMWKLNTSLLKEKEYVNLMNEKINEVVIENSNLAPDLKWEMIKLRISRESIKFAKRRAKDKDHLLNTLKSKMIEIERKIAGDASICNVELLDKATDTRAEIENLLIELKVVCSAVIHNGTM